MTASCDPTVGLRASIQLLRIAHCRRELRRPILADAMYHPYLSTLSRSMLLRPYQRKHPLGFGQILGRQTLDSRNRPDSPARQARATVVDVKHTQTPIWHRLVSSISSCRILIMESKRYKANLHLNEPTHIPIEVFSPDVGPEIVVARPPLSRTAGPRIRTCFTGVTIFFSNGRGSTVH